MNFFERAKRLAREVLSFKNYKKMHPALAVFTGIFLIPFAAAFFIELGSLFVLCIIFTLVQAPINYLHGIVKNEAKEVNPVAHVFIYAISWPLLFILYALFALISLFIYFQYFWTQLVGYIVAIAGYKFHLTPAEEDISKDDDRKLNVQGAVFVGVNALLVISLAVYAVALYGSLYNVYREAEFGIEFSLVASVFGYIFLAFDIIYIPIAFNVGRKPEAVEEIKEIEPVKEAKE